MATNKIEVIQSNGRFSIYLNDHRVTGAKPMPNAKVIASGDISSALLRELLK